MIFTSLERTATRSCHPIGSSFTIRCLAQVGRDVATGVGHGDRAVGQTGAVGIISGSQETMIMLATSDTVIMIIVLASPSCVLDIDS